MNYILKILIFTIISSNLISCKNNDVTAKIYKWESSGLLHTTYFYEVENKSNRNLTVEIIVEATCEDETVYSDTELINVSSKKIRKSSSFFSTDGKIATKVKIVDTKARINPF